MGHDGDAYDGNTVNARNPLARFAHRNRLRRSAALARGLLHGGALLDYGCGSGGLVDALIELGERAVGYDPYMAPTARHGGLLFDDFAEIAGRAPFAVVTLFEVIEHLSEVELGEFLGRARSVLVRDGMLLFSAPIEIGPALFLKELNRRLMPPHWREYGFAELLRAGLFGVPGSRAPDIKISHKGFDFRQAIAALERAGYSVRTIGFGPLPLHGWYGNSQVFFSARHAAEPALE